MGNVWDADVELGPELARELIQRRFPELAPASLELLGSGWDNAAYRVNSQWVFRFPRRKLGAELLRRELRVLPLLSGLPLPIPAPQFFGEPDAGYPYPFAGYPWLSGETACRLTWTEAQRTRSAAPLARFLRALHRLPVDTATRAWAPGDDIRRAEVSYRAAGLLERLRAAPPGLFSVEPGRIAAQVRELASTPPWNGEPRWVHGDLYPRHLLADGEGQLCGVIDWGDVHLGDPALDLSIAFTFLPPGAREAFRSEYGPIDPATWARAEFRALHYGVVLTEYGMKSEDAAIRALGEYALNNAPR